MSLIKKVKYHHKLDYNIFNNLDISLHICKYMLEPGIYILNHSYNNKNELHLNLDKDYVEKQINGYLDYLYYKYSERLNYKLKKNNIFLLLSNDIYEMNYYWRINNHNIYINDIYLIKYFNKHFNIYNNKHIAEYKYRLTYNYKYLKKGYNKKNIELYFEDIYNEIRIKNHQNIIMYWNTYFMEYLCNINNDLSQFKVSTLMNFIREEENIIRELIINDNEEINEMEEIEI